MRLVHHLKDKYGIDAIGVPTDVSKLADLAEFGPKSQSAF